MKRQKRKRSCASQQFSAIWPCAQTGTNRGWFWRLAILFFSCCSVTLCPFLVPLRWFETASHFPLQLNFMKGLLVCSKRLLLLVDSRCCNNLSTYQHLYSHWHFGCHGNLTGPQIHPISSIQLHFTQKVVGKLPFLLHQNCLHIKEHFLRKFKKILSGGFGATLIFCNIRWGQNLLTEFF